MSCVYVLASLKIILVLYGYILHHFITVQNVFHSLKSFYTMQPPQRLTVNLAHSYNASIFTEQRAEGP